MSNKHMVAMTEHCPTLFWGAFDWTAKYVPSDSENIRRWDGTPLQRITHEPPYLQYTVTNGPVTITTDVPLEDAATLEGVLMARWDLENSP